MSLDTMNIINLILAVIAFTLFIIPLPVLQEFFAKKFEQTVDFFIKLENKDINKFED